jgi:hypothetical protein
MWLLFTKICGTALAVGTASNKSSRVSPCPIFRYSYAIFRCSNKALAWSQNVQLSFDQTMALIMFLYKLGS